VRALAQQLEPRLDRLVLVAALLVVPVLVVESADVAPTWRTLAAVGDWVIWSTFLGEGIVSVIASGESLRWLRRHPLEVAVVVLTPPFLPAGIQAMRVLRLFRLLRLLRVASVARKFFTLEGLRYVAVLAVVTLFGGGAAFAAAEGRDISTWDGIWWAITTMTTVGYGDLAPRTDLGRVIAILVMLVGIGFVALLTAALAERFVARDVGRSDELRDIADHELLGAVQTIRDQLDGLEAALRSRAAG
jgi:voltage-gated potassium channel